MALALRLDFTILGLLLLAAVAPLAGAQYIGKRIGSLSQLQHDVAGEVFAVDSRTIHIKGFSYDGAAPDAFFYGGRSGIPSDDGFIIPDENGSTKPLGRYRNKDVTLTLPEGMTLKDVKWISVWCRAFAIDFGHVTLPASLQYPRPQKINALTTLDHGVTSDRIVVVDAQTFLIPNFHYDGAAPGGYQKVAGRTPSKSRNLAYSGSSPGSRFDNSGSYQSTRHRSSEERQSDRFAGSNKSRNFESSKSSGSVFGGTPVSRSSSGSGNTGSSSNRNLGSYNSNRNSQSHGTSLSGNNGSNGYGYAQPEGGKSSARDLASRHFQG